MSLINLLALIVVGTNLAFGIAVSIVGSGIPTSHLRFALSLWHLLLGIDLCLKVANL